MPPSSTWSSWILSQLILPLVAESIPSGLLDWTIVRSPTFDIQVVFDPIGIGIRRLMKIKRFIGGGSGNHTGYLGRTAIGPGLADIVIVQYPKQIHWRKGWRRLDDWFPVESLGLGKWPAGQPLVHLEQLSMEKSGKRRRVFLNNQVLFPEELHLCCSHLIFLLDSLDSLKNPFLLVFDTHQPRLWPFSKPYSFTLLGKFWVEWAEWRSIY